MGIPLFSPQNGTTYTTVCHILYKVIDRRHPTAWWRMEVYKGFAEASTTEGLYCGPKQGWVWQCTTLLPITVMGGDKAIPRVPRMVVRRKKHVFDNKHLAIMVNLDITDSMGPGKLVRHMQNPAYTYDKYLICIELGPSISSVICKNPSYIRHIQVHLYIQLV